MDRQDMLLLPLCPPPPQAKTLQCGSQPRVPHLSQDSEMGLGTSLGPWRWFSWLRP